MDSTLIIRIPLLLVLASLPVFLLVELLMWLAVPGLPGMLVTLGSVMLLSAFSVFIIGGILAVYMLSIRSIVDYFSYRQRLRRRLWFVHARQDQINRLFYFKKSKTKQVHELNKKRLLTLNNRKHIRLLSKAINQDLLPVKKKLPEIIYRQLQQDLACYRKNQDIEALLMLQQKISTLI